MKDKFDFKEAEARIAKFWEDEEVYKYDKHSKKKVYSIDTPPPTMSGQLHMGHAFSYSQADFVARYKRMRGYNVFYPFGFDNNGLATEILVEKVNNTSAEKEGREKFVKLVEAETKKLDKVYRDVWRSVGISTDWSLLYTTIGKNVQKISQISFIELTKKDRTYRKETPTIWCPKEGTSLSQMELKDKMLKSKFVEIKFSDDVHIATTRPELIPACVAIMINPEDKRAKKLVGKKVKVPIFGQEVKIIADKRVDLSKGTGIVMCCTFGDQTDIEWFKAYNLDLKIVIDVRGKMIDHGSHYFNGVKIKEAREQIIKDLKERGLVLGEKEIEHAVNVHERCGTEIEFLVKKQWFIRYLDMKDKLIELGNKLNWYPSHMKVRYENWVNGLQWDWSISRQRFYGVPIPVWYCKKCDEPKFADEKDLPVNPLEDKPKGKCEKCGNDEFFPESDVLDTWATSSLTPLINAGWEGGDKYDQNVFPMSLRPQAHDIISFWLFTTVVKSYLHMGKLPWKDVLISGHALDPKGQAMHKSVGNVIDPLPVIAKFGADPLRYWASLSRLGDDASFQEKDITTGQRTVNKLWNVAKFVEMNQDSNKKMSNNIVDKWITAKAMETLKHATEMFDEYNYSAAKRLIDEFFWFFCDNYLEFIKYRTYNKDTSANYTLKEIYLMILKMYAPFMPYVTEEIYQELFKENDGSKSIHLSSWPEYSEKMHSKPSLDEGDKIYRIIAAVRQWKQREKVALNSEVKELVIDKELKDGIEDIKGAMNIKKISVGKGDIEVPDTEIKIKVEQ